MEKAAVSVPEIPNFGFVANNIKKGRRPLTKKTEVRIPHVKNHFLALLLIPPSTSALMMALSILVMISKIARPKMIKILEKKFM